LSRRPIAMRWAGVWNRFFRPTSRGWDFEPSTIGMSPASQASRLAWPGEMLMPVSVHAVFRPPSRVSRSMVTTTVALIPPAWGSRSTG